METLRKPYPNQHEQMFAELARELGWQVTKKGWPDFFCFNSDSEDAIFVEVKPPGQKLRGSQWLIMRTLTRMGAKCFTSDGVTLIPFDADASIYRMVEPNHDVYAGEWII